MVGERDAFASGTQILSMALLPLQHVDPAQIFSLNHKLGELYERPERPGKRY